MIDVPSNDASCSADATEPSTTLRGAAVAVDPRRAGRVIALVAVLALSVSGVVLLVAGAHQNAQINALKTRGVVVGATVTSCLGQVAGSGSNPTGYSCDTRYRVDGHPYQATLPGTVLRAPGSRVAIVVDRADPSLISTPALLATQRSSARVFLLPLLLLVAALVIGWVLWRRRDRRADGQAQSVRPSLSDLGDDERLGALGGV